MSKMRYWIESLYFKELGTGRYTPKELVELITPRLEKLIGKLPEVTGANFQVVLENLRAFRTNEEFEVAIDDLMDACESYDIFLVI
jgi:hypothetical protein